jgi:Fe-S cluster biogenesis protein NfuA
MKMSDNYALALTFRGQCISCVKAAKGDSFYMKFLTVPLIDGSATEFQINSKMPVDQKDLQKLCDWLITDIRPVVGSKDGRAYAYFSAGMVAGSLVKSEKKGGE